MSKILLAVPMEDGQSGKFIQETLLEMGHIVAIFDWRKFGSQFGQERLNKEFMDAHKELKPDLTIIIKGGGIEAATINKIKKTHKNPIVGWIFDVTLNGIYIKDIPRYIEFAKTLDIFFTIDAEAVTELKELGVNCKWLPQAFYEPQYKEQVFNYIQKKRFGSDVAFIGTVGSFHPIRDKFLERLHHEGFNFKIYGEVLYENGKEPDWVAEHHTGFAVKNDMHSVVVGSSKIMIGLDGWPHRDKSYSLRLYKTLGAGGFYLMNHTKNVEEVFIPGVHLDTFENEDEMVEQIIKYLNDDDLREKIAKAGQKEVLKNHTQEVVMTKLLKDVLDLTE